MNTTPASIKVLSILGIIFSSFIILIMPCSMFIMFHPLTPNPMMDELMKDRGYVVFALISGAISLGFAVMLLSGSIGSLKLRPWGRKVMLAYAWARIVEVVVISTINAIFVLPKMDAAVAAMPAGAGGPLLIGGLVKISTIIGLAFGILFSVAISVVILYFFKRKIAVDAFNGIFAPPPSSFPIDYDQMPSPPTQPPGAFP